jgi:hypothetical protein
MTKFMIKSIKSLNKFITPVTISVFIYLLSVVLLDSWGNFAISDDFYYLTQVKAFSMGIFTKSALVTPTFVLQGLIGLIWGKVFGISYTSLRILTVLFSILCIIGIDKILSLFNVKKALKILTILLITFNPYFYASSLSFMTEIYFLFFLLWSLYYFLLYTKTNKDKNLLIACVLGGLSIMVRQYGVVLFIVYLFVYLLTNLDYKFKKVEFKKILYIVVPFVMFGCLGIFWPKFINPDFPKSINNFLFFTNLSSIVSRLTRIWVIPYICYFLLPFTIPYLIKSKKLIKVLIAFISLPTAYLFFKMNIFTIGNIFYLEGLYAKSYTKINPNIFNNSLFKLVVSYLIALSFTTIAFCLVRKFVNLIGSLSLKKIHISIPKIENASNLIFLLLLIGFYFVVMITDRVFDRYLINFFILLIIFIAIEAEKENFKIGKVSIFLCIFLCSITFLLTFDYYKKYQLKWMFAGRVSKEVGVDKHRIFVDSTYEKAIYMDLLNNFKGIYPARSGDIEMFCFVQEYQGQDENILNNLLNSFEQKRVVKTYLKNPKIENSELLKEKRNSFDFTDILFYDEEYPSPIYNILGKTTYVRAFCLPDYNNY